MSLATEMRERINTGLRRKAVSNAAKWAESYRVMKNGNPWVFTRHPWLRAMHESNAEVNIGQKAAQMGYTETMLNIAFYATDVLQEDCLYVLPSQNPDASDFSSSRLDPAIELSPHLSSIFSDVRNVKHKRTRAANIYLRGSRSRNHIKSLPAGMVFGDEVEEMPSWSVSLMRERSSGQERARLWLISTPSIDGKGINKHFVDSSQNHFFFKCPSCGRYTELIFPDCLVVTANEIVDPRIEDSHLICKECKNVLPHETKSEWLSTGVWIPTFKDRIEQGWYINQLYSCANAVRPANIARSVIKAETNPADAQELWNSKMGLPKSIAGSSVTEEDILKCLRDFKKNDPTRTGRIRTMGIDVGSRVLHVVVAEWSIPKNTTMLDLNTNAIKKHIAHISLYGQSAFDDAVKLFQDFGIHYAVIDAAPERRNSVQFCRSLYGRAKMCYYGGSDKGRTLVVGSDPTEPTVTADRTTWLDTTLGRYFDSKRILLPCDTDNEFKKHIMAPVRIYHTDAQGHVQGRYVTRDNEADHFAHADNYSEIALPFAYSFAASKDISGVF